MDCVKGYLIECIYYEKYHENDNSIFFKIDNCLIILLLIYAILSLVIQNTLSILLKNQRKIIT